MRDFFIAPYFHKIVLFSSTKFSLEVVSKFNESVGMYRTRHNVLQINQKGFVRPVETKWGKECLHLF
jgi:hypothetical protein